MLESIDTVKSILKNRNIQVLTITQSLRMFVVFLWFPYLSLYILELGASEEALGLLLMVRTLFRVVFQFPGGVLADRLGRRRVILLGAALRLFSSITFFYSTHWIHLIPVFILRYSALLRRPAVNSLIAESLPVEKRSTGYSAYRTLTRVPMIATGLLGGMMMDRFGLLPGFKICLLASIAVSAICLIARWMFLEETLNTNSDDASEETEEVTLNWETIIRDMRSMPRGIWILIIVATLSGFALMGIRPFMVVYAVDDIGLTKTEWGAITTVISLLTTLMTMPSGILADRMGYKPFIITSQVLTFISVIGFSLSGTFWHIFTSRVMGGLARGLGGSIWGARGGPVWQALISDLTPRDKRGSIMGFMGTLVGLLTTPATWVTGILYNDISHIFPFQVSAFIGMASTAIFLLSIEEPEEKAR